MNKPKKPLIIAIAALIFVLFAGAVIAILFATGIIGEEEEVVNPAKIIKEGTFGEYTDCKLLKDVPAFLGEGTNIGTGIDLGKNDFVIDVNGTTLDTYKEYIKLLEKEGYKKHSDNGEQGMDDYVYTTNLSKDKLALTVYFIKKYEKTYVAASERKFSDHLIDKAEYHTEGGAQVRLHMPQLNDNGSSFIVELRNGHFVVEDGGIEEDGPYLVDYLESLTPEGVKPVIEGWFITHAHGDHSGALKKIMLDESLAGRLVVDGVYFVEASAKVLELFTSEDPTQAIWYVNNSVGSFKNQMGMTPKIYRPHLGDKFYFDGVTIEIPHTLEQLGTDAWYSGDFNDSSTWYMNYFGEQKFLNAGDASNSSMMRVMDSYDEEYFDMDLFAVLHHGINVPTYFTDYITTKTVLYTSWRKGSIYEPESKHSHVEENQYLQDSALETYSHGEGAVVLTFPYHVGEAKIMPPIDWKYNGGKPKRKVWGVAK